MFADRPATHTVMVALPTPAAYATADGIEYDEPFTIRRDTCTTFELLLVHMGDLSLPSSLNPFSATNRLRRAPRTGVAVRGVTSILGEGTESLVIGCANGKTGAVVSPPPPQAKSASPNTVAVSYTHLRAHETPEHH